MMKQHQSNQMSHTAVSVPRRNTIVERVIGGCFALSIGIMFGGAGLVYVGVYAVIPVINTLITKSWVESPCIVISSETRQNHADEGSGVMIRYRYSCEGREFVGDRYNMSNRIIGSISLREIVTRYPVGAESVCYVNPAAPEESVLTRELVWNPTESLAGLFSILAGLIALSFLFPRLHRKSFTGNEIMAAKTFGESQMHRPKNDIPSGWTVLEPVLPPKRRFLIVLFCAVFLNGIVWVLLWTAFDGFRRQLNWDGRMWFLLLFFAPFVLIGFGFLVGAIYNFMKLFGPKPVLKLSRNGVPLGQSATLEWSSLGRSTAIRKLILSLRGEEWVRYGEDLEDTHVFYRGILCEIDGTPHTAQGAIEITIPDHLMHSWQGGSNRIQWIVELNGSVRGWPDVTEEFYLEVTPHGKAEHCAHRQQE